MIFTEYEIEVKQLPVKFVPLTALNEMHHMLLAQRVP